MQSEPMESASTAPPAVASPPTRSKYRVRFRKAGDLRLVSHHDLMHCFERMFRRAKLPVPSTQGFNPRPRLWFAQSLALGVIGLNEVLELELNEPPKIFIAGLRASVRRAWPSSRSGPSTCAPRRMSAARTSAWP
jgi:hypothetical protein